MITNKPMAFNTKEELLQFSNNNSYFVEWDTQDLIKFIKDNSGKFLYLQNANLCRADLRGANLQNANLQNAKLWNTNLENVKGVPFLT